MINIKFNKRAQIDSTLTWFFAIFIIMFILIIFLVIVFLMADKKSLTNANDLSVKDIGVLNEEGITQNLFALLNSPVDYNGKSEKVFDVIINLSEEYLENIDNYGIDSQEVSNLQTKNRESVRVISERGRIFCSKFYLLTPFALISSDLSLPGKEGNINDYLIQDIDESKYSPVVFYNLNYSNYEIKIKYKQLKNCSGNGIMGGQENV